MEKYITDERTGRKYELAGDYYYLAGDVEPEEQRTKHSKSISKRLPPLSREGQFHCREKNRGGAFCFAAMCVIMRFGYLSNTLFFLP